MAEGVILQSGPRYVGSKRRPSIPNTQEIDVTQPLISFFPCAFSALALPSALSPFRYAMTACRAFGFCLTYKRHTEFRRLCDILRQHLANINK